MAEDNGAGIPDAPESNITNAPTAIGPNIEFAISPHGLIRVAVAQSILMSAFYCDSQAARIIGQQFIEMADKLDQAHEELRRMTEQMEVDTVEQDDTLQVVGHIEPTAPEVDEFTTAVDDTSTDPVLN